MIAVVLAALLTAHASAYPLDGAERTGIRRLIGYRLLRLPPGAKWDIARIVLRLKGVNDGFDLPGAQPDPYLQAGVQKIFGGRDPSYGVAMLDISDPRHPRYASLRADDKRTPGSVGKLLVAGGLMEALRMTFPNDIAAREKLLRETKITADNFIISDSKTVPFFPAGAKTVVNRPLQIGDVFSLWEWADHMLSQSSNAAAAMVWKNAILLRQFGSKYPVTRDQEAAFLRDTPKADLGKLSLETVEAPVRAAGLNTDRLRLGTFFTRTGSKTIPGTTSYATPNELLRWLIKVEQGKLVDEWSSLELKRLLYFSRPRYRYCASPALDNAAVFFKSGSLFECTPGKSCGSYKGDKLNVMHSVAIIESGVKIYMVVIMSNVLGRNSAEEHATIAGEIERLIQARPPA